MLSDTHSLAFDKLWMDGFVDAHRVTIKPLCVHTVTKGPPDPSKLTMVNKKTLMVKK